jgi:hypothetical protein
MRLREREGRKQQTAELRPPAIVPAAVWSRASIFAAIAMTAFVGMTNAEARLGRICELNNHSMV